MRSALDVHGLFVLTIRRCAEHEISRTDAAVFIDRVTRSVPKPEPAGRKCAAHQADSRVEGAVACGNVRRVFLWNPGDD